MHNPSDLAHSSMHNPSDLAMQRTPNLRRRFLKELLEKKVERSRSFPLSFAQQRLWLLDQLNPGNPAFNLSAALRLTGQLDLPAVERSFDEIVRRHETLRTTFSEEDGQPVQRITAHSTLQLPLVNLSLLSAAERESEIRRLAAENTLAPFNLTAGPLVRAKLLRLGEREHVILFAIHHIVADGWSLALLTRELGVLYEAFRRGQPSPLPELPIQYVDFADWQRKWLQGKRSTEQLQYWIKQLDALPVLELPTDQPRPAVQTHRGEACELLLPQPLWEKLKALNAREGVTPFMSLLAVFKTLLSRYTGEQDVVVGTPIKGRNRKEVEGLIGCFLNTLVLRTSLSGNPTYRELLSRVRRVAVEAFASQDLPFERLVESLQPNRDLSRTPLFQVFFNMVDVGSQRLRLPDLVLEPLPDLVPPALFDLTLYAEPVRQGMNLRLVYNVDLFRKERMREVLEQFHQLLAEVVEDPDRNVFGFSLITPVGKERLPDPAEAQQTAWHGAVQDRFSEHARRAPDQVAIRFGEQSLTYRHLDRWSNRLANRLIADGVRPGDVVTVYGARRPSLVCALLGTLKAGAAFAVLDANYPAARLIDCARIAAPRAGILLRAAGPPPDVLREFLDASLGVPCLELSDAPDVDDADPLSAGFGDAPGVTVAADDLAYLAFTSGTTGKPKAIQGTHRPLSHFFPWYCDCFGIRATDRFSMLSGLGHDPLLRDVFAPLWSGATICIPDSDDLSPAPLVDWMRRLEISVAHLTPAHGQLLAPSASQAEGASSRIESLRYVFFGGDVLRNDAVSRFRRVAPSATVVNFYGATETPQAISCYEVRGQHPASGAPRVPIGRGIDDVQLLLVNASRTLCGVGEVGEIHVRTPYLSRGYLGDAALTDERFLSNPFSGREEDRVYRTGDLGRYLPDGNVEILGRIDDQVKIRGFRVEPQEVAAFLASHPQIAQAAVVAREDRSGEKRLVAYVVAAGDDEPKVEGLRAFLGARLHESMVPAVFVPLRELPLTPNGKLDTRALPDPDSGRSMWDQAYVAPRTPTEELVTEIWSEVLHAERVGVHDNFFHLGGHSLLAVQVISRLRDAFDAEVPLRELFEQPTVARLATVIDRARDEGRADSVPPLKPVERTEDLPLSFAQERLWFLDQLEPGSPFYNMPAAVRVTGPLDVAALRASLNEIVSRHEALRTTFATVDGRPVQRIAESLLVPFEVVDLNAVPEAEREEEIRSRAVAEAQRPFDLSAGSLLRVCLLRASATEHVFLLTMHHIVSDGWSMGVFIRELAALYQAFSAGQPSPLEELSVQYADYAAWQREWLSGAVLEEQLDYWQRELGDAPTVLQLPTDRPRGAVQSPRGSRHLFELSAELTESLQALSRRQGATLFMTLLAAFQTLLSRYSGQEQVCVGTPIAGRNRSQLEGLIGFFVNTLVLRGDLSGNPRFEEFLGRVRQTTLDAYAQQDLPFEQLVDHLQPERDLSRTPLFQVMFAFQNTPMQDVEVADLSFSTLAAETGTAKFDLTLTMNETEGGLRGSIEYSTDLFDRSTIERMTEHFRQLLKAMADDPTQRVSELPLLNEQERRQILIDWNATDQSYPRGECIHELFAERAAGQPDAIAVVFGDNRLTYRQLDEQSNQLAHHLRSLGVGPDVLVGIYSQRSMKLVVGLLGILKAGGAYVPLDPSFPQQRIEWMLEDTQAPVLLVQDSLLERLPEYPGKVVRQDADWETIARQPAQRLEKVTGAEHLAYVIFTSGSTGRPKGVMIPHRALVNFLCSMQREPGLELSDVLLSVTTFSFDIFGLELHLPLFVGATVVVADDETASDAVLLQQELERCEATVMQATPATWRMLLQANWPGRSGLKMLVGGEALDAQLARELLKRGDTLWNLYGPTETTIWSTARRIPRDFEKISIGRPIGNTQIYILDERMEPVPVGVRGDLYIGGDGLARGYLNRPELTDEKFIAAPFDSLAGARLYKTGDQARWLANGEIEFLGRVDHQVKVRGYRIELGEIESVLSEHQAVHQAVVVARPDPMGEQRLVAYVVFVDGQRASVESLREALGSRLPDYMIPSVFETLDAFPLTPNGKVDRKALPEPSSTRPELGKQYVPPRNATEESLAAIWSEVLGVEQVGVHDSFFELGGHSLLATRVVSRAAQVLNVEVRLRDLFHSPTIAGLAEQIASAQRRGARPRPPIVPVPRDGELPASYTQEALWFLDQLEPDLPTYTSYSALEVEGPLDVAALERALNNLVERHEALRTRFPEVNGKPVQVIEPPVPRPLPVVDLTRIPESDRESELERWLLEETGRPIDLQVGPLLRMTVLRLAETRHVVAITLHHIVDDGWSSAVMARELIALYEACRSGHPDLLPELPIQYADFAVWQRELLQGETLDELRDFWVDRLADTPPLQLPSDYPHPSVRTTRGARRPCDLSPELSAAVSEFCRREGVTPFMALLGAFQLLISRYSGQDDFAIGSPVANRSQPETESLIGYFINVIVLRSDLSGEPGFREVVNRVKQVALDAFDHQEMTFDQVVQAVKPPRDSSRHPLFQVMFVLQTNEPPALGTPELRIAPLAGAPAARSSYFELTLELFQTDQEFRGWLHFNSDLFHPDTVDRMVQHFLMLLREAIADPDRPISCLPIATDEELRQMVVDRNDTETDFPQDACIHRLFAEQVKRSPDAVALIDGPRQWTYRELNERANQLAYYLWSRGVGPGHLTAVRLPRSADFVAAVLGVLKAGGAYLPLDILLPVDRLYFILEDAQVAVVITEQQFRGDLPESLQHVVCLDLDQEQIGSCPVDDPAGPATSENLAYVIYTSGSTGRPKGVMIEHRALVNYTHAAAAEYQISSDDRVLQFASVSFDAHVEEIYPCLTRGGTLVLRSDDMLDSYERFLSLCEQWELTVLTLPTNI